MKQHVDLAAAALCGATFVVGLAGIITQPQKLIWLCILMLLLSIWPTVFERATR